MKHAHHWIIDSTGFGRCKCKATKQFHTEKIQRLRPSEVATIKNLSATARDNPDAWCHERTPEILRYGM